MKLLSAIYNGILLEHSDDATLICSGFSPSEVAATLNHQLSLVNHWLVNSIMKLNIFKSYTGVVLFEFQQGGTALADCCEFKINYKSVNQLP